MNIYIKLKEHKINELIKCLENRSTSFEDMYMVLMDNDNYKCELNITVVKLREIAVVFKVSLINNKSKVKETKLIYFYKPHELFGVLDLKLLNVDISLKLDFIDKTVLNSYYGFSSLEKLIEDDFDNLFKLIKFSQFSEEMYLAETLAMSLAKSVNMTNEFSIEQHKYLKDKLSYYGYDFELLAVLEKKTSKTKLEEIIYAFLSQLCYGSIKNELELHYLSNKLYREFVIQYFKGTIKGKAVMGCRTTTKK